MGFLQPDLKSEKGPRAAIKTSRGDITVQLFPELAPKTVQNFIEFSKKDYYDGVIFRCVIPDFMIQGGDSTGTRVGGESIYGESFEDEFSRELFNFRGALSMANSGPNTNGSQFFIVNSTSVPASMLRQLEGAEFLSEIIEAYKGGGAPWLDFRHTVFGHVLEGMDTIGEITNVQCGPRDRPVHDIVIETTEISE